MMCESMYLFLQLFELYLQFVCDCIFGLVLKGAGTTENYINIGTNNLK
jgi:hypothetical protein